MTSPILCIPTFEQWKLGAVASARLSRNSVVLLERMMQPQKGGLSIDVDIGLQEPPERLRRRLSTRGVLSARRFPPHSDPRQKAFFFSLVKECLTWCQGSEDVLRHALAVRDLRPEFFVRVATCGDCGPVA
jgi:hypothetical protein